MRRVEALSAPVDVTMSDDAPPGLAPMADMFSRVQKQTMWPIHFRGVTGQDKSVALSQFSGTESWQNPLEAAVVVEIIDTLIANGIKQSSIGAMSPFRGQVMEIRRLLRKKHYHDVNVGTIENYQAVEQDVIVLSLCRSKAEFIDFDVKKRMGVFGQTKQSNVAMTRAENLFIVVGDPATMWKDTCWRQWLRFCCRNGLWYGEGLEEWKLTNGKVR